MTTKDAKKAAVLLNDEGTFSPNVLHWIEREPNTVLLETTRVAGLEDRSLLFAQPRHVIECRRPEAVNAGLEEIEQALRDGYYVAGFLAYEAGYAFEKALALPCVAATPLLWFGVYEEPIIYNHLSRSFECGRPRAERLAEQLAEIKFEEAIGFSPQPAMTEEEYREAIAAIKAYIAAGDTYQVNFTFKLRFPFHGSAAARYHRLRRAQRVSYSAFLSLPERYILSLSPELFFRWEDRQLTLKPMKGTARRGRNLEEDELQKRALLHSEKNRAENLMIVDLLRNDAGRIAETGSVYVPRFFDIEKYETVLQATSTITANLRANTTIADLLRSLFPCGSITGAPKIRTVQIIHELEKEPRGVYTGAIGYFTPHRKTVFNVAIRTVVLDRESGVGEMGIGSGVVWDSVAEAEYRECLLKARFLTESPDGFQIFETLRWDNAHGYGLLQEHLHRLRSSAEYFGFRYDENVVRGILQKLAQQMQQSSNRIQAFRVRLTLDQAGNCEVEHAPLEALAAIVPIGFARERTNSQDRFLFHKTTRREHYDRALEEAKTREWFDMIFLNERGEVTEGARSNIVIKHGEEYFTPPITCGVLPGTYRTHLLASQSLPLREKIFYRDEVEAAEEVWVCNAVRGLVRAELQLMFTESENLT